MLSLLQVHNQRIFYNKWQRGSLSYSWVIFWYLVRTLEIMQSFFIKSSAAFLMTLGKQSNSTMVGLIPSQQALFTFLCISWLALGGLIIKHLAALLLNKFLQTQYLNKNYSLSIKRNPLFINQSTEINLKSTSYKSCKISPHLYWNTFLQTRKKRPQRVSL